MTLRSGKQGEEDENRLPLPALFQQGKEIVVEQLHKRLAEDGFDGILYWHGAVFRFIDAEGSRLTALADRSGFTKQAIGEVVGELERHGYVERTTDSEDRRAKIIRLTDRGVQGKVAAARILADIEARWERHLGGHRIADLRRTLEEVIHLERGE